MEVAWKSKLPPSPYYLLIWVDLMIQSRGSSKGCHTHRFLPKVSGRLHFCCPLMNIFLFNIGHFPAFMYLIGKLESPDCVCRNYGDSLNYICDCELITQFHLNRPSPRFEELWYRTLLKSSSSVKVQSSLGNSRFEFRGFTLSRFFLITHNH